MLLGGRKGGRDKMDREKILDLLEKREYKELKEELGNLYPVDIAEFLENVDEKQMLLIFRLLGKKHGISQ